MYKYKKRQSGFKKFVKTVLLIGVISSVTIFIYNMYVDINVYSSEQNTNSISASSTVYKEQNDNTQMLENIIKGIVGISKIKDAGNSIFLNDSISDLGLGTGIIVSENGYILTNWHIAGDKYSNCYVTLENGNTVSGNVVWADKDIDLAIIKINATNLNAVALGDSDNIKVGEQVYAVGNPIGVEFQRTVTSGIISGINRTVKIDGENEETYIEDLIQTDATINSANSGGPLINSDGEVVGINSTNIEETDGISFAIPINIIKPIIESFTQNGEFEEAYLGVFAYDKSVISYLDSDLKFDSGIYVAKILEDGPSYNSGLKIGDIIIKIDDIEINKMSELRSYIYSKKVGDEISLTILRENKERNLNIKLTKNLS